jgi:hypothetical protein
VAEKDAEVRFRVRELAGLSLAAGMSPRIDPHNLDAPAAQLDLDRFVAEQGHAFESGDRIWVDPLRERVAAVREVVVAEDGEARRERTKEPREHRRPGAPRDEVARDADEVRAALDDPGQRILDCPPASGGHSEMEVGEMGDP